MMDEPNFNDAGFHDAIHSIIDRLDAYAAALAAHGYSTAVIEVLIEQYHWLLMQELDRLSAARTSQS